MPRPPATPSSHRYFSALLSSLRSIFSLARCDRRQRPCWSEAISRDRHHLGIFLFFFFLFDRRHTRDPSHLRHSCWHPSRDFLDLSLITLRTRRSLRRHPCYRPLSHHRQAASPSSRHYHLAVVSLAHRRCPFYVARSWSTAHRIIIRCRPSSFDSRRPVMILVHHKLRTRAWTIYLHATSHPRGFSYSTLLGPQTPFFRFSLPPQPTTTSSTCLCHSSICSAWGIGDQHSIRS